MSVFGTTMTAFALVGSTGKSFERGIGTHGLMASISGLVHAAIFFLIGVQLWALEKSMVSSRKSSFFGPVLSRTSIGYLLFPILVLLVIPYLLIGIIELETIEPVTAGAFLRFCFTDPTAPQWLGGAPPWLTGLVGIISSSKLCIYGGFLWSCFCKHLSDYCFHDHGFSCFYIHNKNALE